MVFLESSLPMGTRRATRRFHLYCRFPAIMAKLGCRMMNYEGEELAWMPRSRNPDWHRSWAERPGRCSFRLRGVEHELYLVPVCALVPAALCELPAATGFPGSTILMWVIFGGS